MTKINQKFALILVFALYACVQFFFVSKYYTDKTTVPPQIAESMYEYQSLVASDFSCYHPNGSRSIYPTWAEEPPVFHASILVFKFLGLDLYYFKLFPILCFCFVFWGLLSLARLFLPKDAYEKNLLFIGLLILFQPYFYIHFSRILPDNLALGFLVWSIYFFYQRRYLWAIPLAFLAVTTKALAIFPIAFIVGYYFFFFKKDKISKRFIVSSLFALSLVPTLVWFYYLKSQGILNPFFNPDGGMHHMAGTALESKIWTRVLRFGILRGISIPVFLLLVYYVWKQNKCLFKEITTPFPILILGYLFMIFMIKGLFATAPWYSFYFIVFFLLYALREFVVIEWKWRLLIVALVMIPTLRMVEYSFRPVDNITQNGKELFIDLPCKDFLLNK